jgi:hypothetical protein
VHNAVGRQFGHTEHGVIGNRASAQSLREELTGMADLVCASGELLGLYLH